jgi:aminocarboxymuconate-semialdehyde decarboxylase
MPTTSLLHLFGAITRKGSEIDVKLVPSAGRMPAPHFDVGFKLRSFFPRLAESMSQPRNKLDEQGIDCRSRASTADQ